MKEVMLILLAIIFIATMPAYGEKQTVTLGDYNISFDVGKSLTMDIGDQIPNQTLDTENMTTSVAKSNTKPGIEIVILTYKNGIPTETFTEKFITEALANEDIQTYYTEPGTIDGHNAIIAQAKDLNTKRDGISAMWKQNDKTLVVISFGVPVPNGTQDALKSIHVEEINRK